MNNYPPAVTRVEEWTREDTGVGAAIAAGSQAENGIWALLVRLATKIKEHNPTLNPDEWIAVMLKL